MSLPEFSDHNHLARMTKTLIQSCHRCKLGEGANRVVYGGVSWRPKLLLLGEAPGRNEDEAGEPFVGAAGRLLDQMLGSVGLSRHKVMIANTVCCRPPGNRDPEWSEIEACKPNRMAQINLARTWVGVTMGRIALSSLLEDPGIQIGREKGQPFWLQDKVWVPTYHPAYALRNKNAVAEIASHLKMALDIYEGKRDAPTPKTSDWVMVAGKYVVMDHETVKVPSRVMELAEAVFTKDEWMKMAYSKSMLDPIARIKRELGARVVR